MNVLVATDAKWLADEIVSALSDDHTSFAVCDEGREVSRHVARVAKQGGTFDIGVFDLQIGSMGGMAVTMALRLDAGAGTAPAIPTLMLLDRVADVHLAKRSGADGWLIKPLDPLRLRRAVRTIAAGGTYTEGLALPADEGAIDTDTSDVDAEDGDEPTSELPDDASGLAGTGESSQATTTSRVNVDATVSGGDPSTVDAPPADEPEPQPDSV